MGISNLYRLSISNMTKMYAIKLIPYLLCKISIEITYIIDF
jgi:hypothetical protein